VTFRLALSRREMTSPVMRGSWGWRIVCECKEIKSRHFPVRKRCVILMPATDLDGIYLEVRLARIPASGGVLKLTDTKKGPYTLKTNLESKNLF